MATWRSVSTMSRTAPARAAARSRPPLTLVSDPLGEILAQFAPFVADAIDRQRDHFLLCAGIAVSSTLTNCAISSSSACTVLRVVGSLGVANRVEIGDEVGALACCKAKIEMAVEISRPPRP